jgi:hypothetical protein
MTEKPYSVVVSVYQKDTSMRYGMTHRWKSLPFRSFHTEEEAIDYALDMAEKHNDHYDPPSKEHTP